MIDCREDLGNRAEVPATVELNTMVAMGTQKGWSVGSFDQMTAFIHAELCEEEDGVISLTPPSSLVRLGFVQPGIVWVLKKALAGLRVAPTSWSIKRDATQKGTMVKHCGMAA